MRGFPKLFTTFLLGGATATALHHLPDLHHEDYTDTLKNRAYAATPFVSNRPTEIMKFGFPGNTNLKMRSNYVLSYDRRNRNPIWVFEHLNKQLISSTKNSVDRKYFDFVEDESIPEMFRATNKDFYKSGFDRGHLAAAANHKSEGDWMKETFLLSNISPQVPSLNQITWNNLEKYTRSLTHHYDDIYVCSGPLYLPKRYNDGHLYVQYRVLEPNHVAVPTHFFKVIVCQKKNFFDVQCYVMPNEKLEDPEQPIDNFLVPLESVEKASGLNICSVLAKDKIRLMNKQKLK